jgi:23S rRNA pseudouridine1911/1915/1917 synthase
MEDVAPTRIHVRQCCHPDGRPCRTEFEVLRRVPARGHLPAMSLIRCVPHTGRMHQIRVHLAYLGHPIIGDKIYGGNEQNYLDFIETGWTPQLAERLFIERHALHAAVLSFPLGDSVIKVNSPMPDDMRLLLEQ